MSETRSIAFPANEKEISMKEEIVEADVLCVGGGIAGLMASIRAGELGAKVIVAEKANTVRSGAGATGNDHFMCYIPEIHGPDIERQAERSIVFLEKGSIRTKHYVRTYLEKTFAIAQLWERWGIPMKPTGQWEFSGHAVPGVEMPEYHPLKYAGQNQKHILTAEARKRGVEIVNRVTVFDLLRDDSGIIGVIGTSTREKRVIVFKAKSVVLGTGICARLYPSPTPGWMFNRSDPPSTTGEGRAMAYRAGAELVNMEIPRRWAGPKYFARNGKGSWIGVVRDPADKPVGPFVTRPDKRYGDAIGDYYTSLFEEYMKSGRGPVYMDCRGISEDDYIYMLWGLSNEGNSSLINHLKEEDIDIRKHAVEFMTYELSTRGGILYNEKAETSIKGLYAAVDEYFGGISGAAVMGWIAGDNAAGYAKNSRGTETSRAASQIEAKKGLLEQIRNRAIGASWQEVNIALAQVMHDYAGLVRSESLLQAGLSYLLRLKEKAYREIVAKNQHELMHCLEVLNSFDVGESIFISALERKETRDDFVRSDYPFTNPQYNNKMLICKKADDKPLAEWRDKQ
jgi:succinate dehydrogenase/fumarate reductase flavoprotein subunit